jgi:hypothetical protein
VFISFTPAGPAGPAQHRTTIYVNVLQYASDAGMEEDGRLGVDTNKLTNKYIRETVDGRSARKMTSSQLKKAKKLSVIKGDVWLLSLPIPGLTDAVCLHILLTHKVLSHEALLSLGK